MTPTAPESKVLACFDPQWQILKLTKVRPGTRIVPWGAP
jgi:hypothetical protein